MMEIQRFVQYTIVQSHWYIYFTLIVGVKIVGRPNLADWKTKTCLIIVLKQVEEKISKSATCLQISSVQNCVFKLYVAVRNCGMIRSESDILSGHLSIISGEIVRFAWRAMIGLWKGDPTSSLSLLFSP